MSASNLIICEKTSHWTVALRRGLGRNRLRIAETRSLAGCREALAAAPASVVAIHTTAANFQSVIELMLQASQRYPQARIAALLGPEEVSLGLLLQEAGASDVICSVLEVPRLARLARRHIADLPQPELSIGELVEQRLPWKSHATTSR